MGNCSEVKAVSVSDVGKCNKPPEGKFLLVKQYQEKLSNLKHWVIDH